MRRNDRRRFKKMDNGGINLEISQKEIDLAIKNLQDFVKDKKDFQLSKDKDRVNKLVRGILYNEKRYGLKFCPCRIQTKIREKDLKLVCPCNFKAQKTWQDKKECWCGLFEKR